MAIQARCPECNKTYNLADHMLGKSVLCKQCAQPFTVKPTRKPEADFEPASQKPSGIRAQRAPAVPPPEEDEAARAHGRVDEDEPSRRPRKPQKSGSALTLWLILGGAGVLVLAGAIVLVIVLAKRSPSDPDIPDVDVGGEWPKIKSRFGRPVDEWTVVFHVAGVFDEYTQEEVNRKAGRLAEPGRGGTSLVSAADGRFPGRVTIHVRPVGDVDACAKRVDFGEVRGVSGRVITVVARKAAGPPPGADPLTKALFDLKIESPQFRERGLQEIKGMAPNEQRRAEVAKALEDFLAKETNPSPRAEAVQVLAKWATKDNVPTLLRALTDKDRFVQTRAMEALAGLKEPAAIEPIAERLESNWPDAGKALRAFGPKAEPALIKCMDSPTQRTRELACEILKDTGTKASVPALAKALGNRSTRENALRALERLKAVEAADAIAACLEDSGPHGEAGRILKAFGPEAEPALIKCVEGPNKQAREAACEILKDTGTKACVEAMKKALADRAMRRNALQTLDRLKAVEAAEAVARCLDEFGERGEASRILKRFGPAAEKAVIRYLQSTDRGVRHEACMILGEIGTRVCVPFLFEAVRLDNGLRGAAEDALKRIQARNK
jgi:HEAT repeat protein